MNFSSQDFSLQTLRMRLLCYRKIKLHLRKLNFFRGLTWCQCMWNMGKLTLTPLKLQFLGWYGYHNTPFYGADAQLILDNYSIQPQCPIQPPRPFLSFFFEVAFQSRKLLKSLVSRYLFMLKVQKDETPKLSEIRKKCIGEVPTSWSDSIETCVILDFTAVHCHFTSTLTRTLALK